MQCVNHSNKSYFCEQFVTGFLKYTPQIFNIVPPCFEWQTILHLEIKEFRHIQYLYPFFTTLHTKFTFFLKITQLTLLILTRYGNYSFSTMSHIEQCFTISLFVFWSSTELRIAVSLCVKFEGRIAAENRKRNSLILIQ